MKSFIFYSTTVAFGLAIWGLVTLDWWKVGGGVVLYFVSFGIDTLLGGISTGFEDHLDRLRTVLYDAKSQMMEAGACLQEVNPITKERIPHEMRNEVANKSIKGCIKALQEAMWIAEQAIKKSNGKDQKLDLVLDLVESPAFVKEYIFFSDEITRKWEEGYCETWVSQFNSMLPSSYSRRAKAS